MHSLTILYMVYSTRMRTLDRWSLSVVLRKSSILMNVCCFSTVQMYGKLIVPPNLFSKKTPFNL